MSGSASGGVQNRFQGLRQKVHDYVQNAKDERELKKMFKEDPAGTLLAADIGFADLAEAREFIYWEVTTE